ncbi:protein NATD1-like [Chiloscyllium plagiosum]|uniref:protein NATD1-like n=1 Tax=Chiloscyllium plagiosum TaxID=36176 RepID=UPI001CB80D6C|nr:protein NATD1-like [Chiloscyllium plagiosum]
MSGRSLLKHWPVMSKSISRPGTSASTSTHPTIKHDRANHQFSIKLDDDQNCSHHCIRRYSQAASTIPNSRDEAVLRYKYIGKKMVDLYSTQVPVKFRGQGIGVRLAQAAMNFVVEEDLKVRTSCWFVKKYLDDNPLPKYTGRIVN